MSSLQQALSLWRGGQRQEAQALCESLVAASDDPQALSLLAEMYEASGEGARAASLLKRLAAAAPADAGVQRRLGNVLLAAGRVQEAIASYQAAIAIEPGSARAHNNLGQALMRLHACQEAVASYQRAIALDPGYAIAHNNLGLALKQQGLTERALESYRHAADLAPQLAEAHFNAGEVLLELQRAAEALVCYDRALAARPDLVAAFMGRGTALTHLRRFESALADFDHVLELAPPSPQALCSSASALLELKRPEQALARCEQALALKPDFPEAHNNKSGALRQLGRHDEAVAACDSALALQPDYSEALCNRGLLLREMGEHAAAQASYRRALEVRPEHAAARIGLLMSLLPAVPASALEVQAGRAAFASELESLLEWLREGGDLDETEVVGVAQPFFLAYQELDNRELLARYGSACCELMARWQQRRGLALPQAPPAGAKVRVALVSGHVREHPVFRALTRGWLEQLDTSRLEVGVFHVDVAEDGETERARARAAFFVSGERTLSEWVEAIRAARLDVLIYPEVGMNPTSLRLASLRLAPQQLAAWGHPETTGLPTIDYYLSAEALEPADGEDHYCERLVRLPKLGCYYEPQELILPPLDLAGLGMRPEHPVLLCPGTPYKYAPQHDAVLVEIARRLAPCQLLFFEPPGTYLSFLARRLRERLRRAFRAGGIEPDGCLLWLPWLNFPAFRALMRRATLCLDTIGFSGFNTALHAIESDLPVIAYEGRFLRGRLASGLLRLMGLSDLIARTPDQYIELATRIARDERGRHGVQERLRASRGALFRDHAAVDALSELLVRLARGARERARPE
jgi:predicted O-linked N-acetylglucosamine transferase (SPINDLY family)